MGMLVCIPVWFAESWIEGLATGMTDQPEKALIQQVLGAAVTEEAFIFLGACLVWMWYRRFAQPGPVDLVVVAVSVAIGFTTIENGLAVYASPNPPREAISRFSSIVAGHAELQLAMGYFAAMAVFGKRHRALYAILTLAIPIAIHGWGDFTERLFQYYDTLYPNAEKSKLLMSAWLLGLTAYILAGIAVLWQILYVWRQPGLWEEEPHCAEAPQ
jgi:RsiW-degrading membrane proteinase PrsW (M82 family)